MNEIDELFARDPLDLSDQDLEKIVAKIREDAKQWAADEAAGKTRRSRPAPIDGSPDDILKGLGL